MNDAAMVERIRQGDEEAFEVESEPGDPLEHQQTLRRKIAWN